MIQAWDGKALAVDVTVCHPAQVAERPGSREATQSFLSRQEEAKSKKYAEACQLEGWAFSGAAFDTWGHAGPAASLLLKKIFRRAVQHLPLWERSRRMAELREGFHIALLRHVWFMLGAGDALS